MDMRKSVLGVVLGITAFCTFMFISRMTPVPDYSASIYELIVSAIAGASLVPFLRFLAGFALGMSGFFLWIAITENGIHVIAAIMLPVVFGWSLGMASLGYGLGTLISYNVRRVLDRLGKR